MLVLGIHMGHDAGVAVVSDGKIVSLVERERHTRVKHAGISTIEDIELALQDAGASLDDVDYVSISGTQNWPFIFYDSAEFRFDIDPELDGPLAVPGTVRDLLRGYRDELASTRSDNLAQIEERYRDRNKLGVYLARPLDISAPGFDFLGTYEFPFHPGVWDANHSLRDIRGAAAAKLPQALHQWMRLGAYHVPVRVRLRHRMVAGVLVSHHTAHAASAFFQSDFDSAAVQTTDGSMIRNAFGHGGGLFCAGRGNKIWPLLPNFLTSGNMYMRVGRHLHLDRGHGAPGKLMGLAPYGKPRFFDPNLVGNAYDAPSLMLPTEGNQGDYMASARTLVERARAMAKALGYERIDPSPDNKLSPFNKDLAASTQKLFEEQGLLAALTLFELCFKLGLPNTNLVLSGGCALNCPFNSRVWREGPFEQVFVPPSCDDSGLAIGSALYLSHHVLDLPRQPQGSRTSTSAYLGRRHPPEATEHALRAAAGDLVVTPVGDVAAEAGKALADDKVIAWYEGRSEIGPRALGHRSILADPRRRENWERVNRIKSREAWRPFAPAVLEEHAADWFDGAPLPSPFMLFTARVRSRDLPAITHVDGSARLQTVDRDCGGFRRVLESFHHETGVPVVLNTSFNGPGEPIAETPEDAVDFFRRSTLDRLYFDGFRVERRSGPTEDAA